ncbi:PAS domain S-box protein [Roseivirga spongicola]|nr:PAS domain S-box protein [Roseivirga spongicola]
MRYSVRLLFILSLFGNLLFAQNDPHQMWRERPINQNVIKNWEFSNPLGRATVWDIDQDKFGFIWLATSEGVIRFDGRRSTVFNLNNTSVFESQDFAQVEVAQDGKVWVCGRDGLYYYDGEKFNEWVSDDVEISLAWKIITRQDGSLIALANGQALEIDETGVKKAPFGIENAYQLKRGFDDRIWVMLNTGKVKYVKDKQLYDLPEVNEYTGEVAIRMVVDDAEGNLYISLDDERLLYYNHEEFIEINSEKAFDIGLVRNLFPDSHGFVWASSVNGTYRFSKDKVESLTTHDGLSDNGVRTLFEDRNGDIWIGTYRGLNYIPKSPVGLVQLNEGGVTTPVETKAVIEASDGNIWVATGGKGLYLYQKGELVKPKASFRMPSNIFTINEQSNGDLLIGGENGLIKVRYQNGVLEFLQKIVSSNVRFAYATGDDVVWINEIGGLAKTRTLLYRDNELVEVPELNGKNVRWINEFQPDNFIIGTLNGLFRYYRGEVTEVGGSYGFSTEAFTSYFNGEENLWAVTEGKGLIRYEKSSGQLTTHNSKNGFSISSPTAIMMDANSGVWFSSLSGLYRVALSELKRNIIEQDSLKSVEYYPANVTVSPAGHPINWKAKNGVIYYSSPNGLVVVNENYRAPRTRNYQVQSITVDGEEYHPEEIVEIPPYSNKISIRFSTIDFQERGDLSFEYKLEGFDKGWYNIKGVRDIYYTNLPAGNYSFRLREVNSDGYYEEANQAFTIIKAKYWYRTNLAIILYIVLIILLFVLAYRARTRSIREHNSRLQEQVISRTTRLEEVLFSLEEKVEERTSSLLRANEQLNLAMDAGKHASYVWSLNKKGERVAEYSDRYFKLLGYEPQSFQTTWDNFIEIIHPDDKEYVVNTIEEMLDSQRSIDPITTFEVEYRARRKDGAYIWMSSNGKLLESRITGLVTDISDRKEAELEQKSSHEMFQKLFEQSTSAHLLVDSNGAIVMQNAKAESVFGYQGEEWKSVRVEDLIPHNYRGHHVGLREGYHKAEFSAPITIERDLEGLTKAGEVIPLQIGVSPINLQDKKYTLVLVIDMSERVKMENALKSSKQELQRQRDRYMTIFQNISDALFILDVDDNGEFKFVEFNKAQEAIINLSTEQVANKSVSEVFPDFAEYLEWRYSTCRDSLQTITYREQLSLKTGKRDFDTSLVPIIENGKVVRIIGIAHEITGQLAQDKLIKDKEEKLRYALQASQDAIFDWNMTNGIMEFSDALFRMLEYDRSEIDENLESLMKIAHSGDIDNIHKADLLRIINKLEVGEQFASSFRMKKKSGEWLWVLLKGKVVERDAQGRAQRFVGIITDITGEREKTKEKLETVLLTEDNERSRISREIHDGLQQTLTITALNMEFAKKEVEKLSEKGKEKFNTAWEYLQKSIAESRTVAHSLMPKAIVDFGLVSACKSLIMQYDNSIEETAFRFDENLADERIADKNVEVTLYRILQESINNIIKYARASEVNVQLKMFEDIILMTIEDNGVGFDVEAVKAKGNGYGLRSMQNRIDAISAHLEIDSAPGKGTVVIVEILKEALE